MADREGPLSTETNVPYSILYPRARLESIALQYLSPYSLSVQHSGVAYPCQLTSDLLGLNARSQPQVELAVPSPAQPGLGDQTVSLATGLRPRAR
jgi:hypothetical protein